MPEIIGAKSFVALDAESKKPAFSAPAEPAWFCLRSQTKHEHIAAQHLRQIPDLEVFLPRIRFRRKTRQGAAWVTEALFPGYLFARFDWASSLRLVHHTTGVRGVVHFGDRWPTVPEETITALRDFFNAQELHVIPAAPGVGDSVRLVGGALHGLQAVVTQVMPARQRVMVLLDFLGRQTTMNLPDSLVVREEDHRQRIYRHITG